jgi:methionyl-tRNA synthetase
VLDQLGIPADERNLAALADSAWYLRRVATAEPLGAPSPAFPRLELPAEDEPA